jgi:hypothetical protein
MEYKSEKDIDSLIEKRIENEIEKIVKLNAQLRDNMQQFYQDSFEKLTNNLIENLKIFGKEVKGECTFLSTVGEKNTDLEQDIKDLKQNLIKKNTEIIELETEKKNWNKVSYTKFLDKQLQEKKKDLEVLQLRFDHISKQNQILKDKLREKTNQMKDICISNNIEIISGDEISLSESIHDTSILDNNEDILEMNIKMDIKDKKESDIETDDNCENKTDNKDTENEEDKQNINDSHTIVSLNNAETEKDDNVSNSSEATLSSSNEISQEYEVYEYQNKKGQQKKYLKKKEGKKNYLFKYTTDKEKIGDAVGEIREKNNIEKPSFYRKKN